MTSNVPLMKHVLTSLAKNVLLPFGLSAGMSGAAATIQKKIYGSDSPLLIHKDMVKIVNHQKNQNY